MREILFRGKRVDNGEWAESPYPYGTISGGVVQHDFTFQTVGQYTGLTDKNGVKIFEGDIIRTAGNLKRLFVVCWSDKSLQFVKKDAHLDDGTEYGIPNIKIFLYEIVGNIHDNPELTGGDDK